MHRPIEVSSHEVQDDVRRSLGIQPGTLLLISRVLFAGETPMTNPGEEVIFVRTDPQSGLAVVRRRNVPPGTAGAELKVPPDAFLRT